MLKIWRLNDDFAKSMLKYEYEGRQEITEVFKAMVGSDSTALRSVCFPDFLCFPFRQNKKQLDD